MASHETKDSKVSFKDTLNLPRTDFPIRANGKVDDPIIIERWKTESIFKKTFDLNAGNTKYILHDGPPYANGHIHIGHAYNKILKDIVTKSHRMMAKHVPVTPGWDCHGLPIEQKVTKEHPNLSPEELKKECRKYAQHWIDVQRQEFIQLGVLMNWDHPYITMSFGYEASILHAFGKFVADGYIERKNKTVPWCPFDQTVLASAEIEYQERKDPSIYVLFQLDPQSAQQFFPTLNRDINFLVWTTTPWTLPLNRAVLIKPATEYVILDLKGTYCIVAKSLADTISAMMGVEKNVITEFSSDELLSNSTKALHPFIDGLKVPVISDQSVLLEDGTACVHCAPGCGPEDYEVGVKNGLEIFSPISPGGKYTAGIVPHELEGMPVADGQIWVIKKLAENGRLLFKSTIKHAYPHCWRCHNPLIFRATRQWFCDLSKGGLKQRVLDAIPNINTLPEKSINRLKATIEGRLEWVLSRQRIWGVPIPALLCTKCDYTYVTQGLVDRVAEGVAQEGIEYWDRVDAQDILPKGFSCPLCTNTTFRKETDILDVWFDSGVSHFAVLLNNSDLAFPADIYLEGSDQHRGWFQSSLLTAIALEGKPPMKMIYTHGFVVDQQGRKMSKSIGNVVSPADIINKVGTDGLRLWASSLDNTGDAVVSDVLIANIQQVFSKIRNTCRFLLSNLYDFDIEKDAVPFAKMNVIDQYAMLKIYEFHTDIWRAYEDIDLSVIAHRLGEYCAVDLSAFYLDISKDRLYVEKANGFKRRSAQTVYWHILDTLTRLIAPILSFTAEQVSDHYQKNKQQSIHLQQFADLKEVFAWINAESKDDPAGYIEQQDAQWKIIKEIRSAVLKAIEGLREKEIVKLPLQARIVLHLDADINAALKSLFDQLADAKTDLNSFFKELFIVSQVEIADDTSGLEATAVKGLSLKAEHARGQKCPRCWQWDEVIDDQGLDRRCHEVLK